MEVDVPPNRKSASWIVKCDILTHVKWHFFVIILSGPKLDFKLDTLVSLMTLQNSTFEQVVTKYNA